MQYLIAIRFQKWSVTWIVMNGWINLYINMVLRTHYFESIKIIMTNIITAELTILESIDDSDIICESLESINLIVVF